MGPEAQFREFDRDNRWVYVYHRIREETLNNDYTLNAAKLPDHRARNRYRDVSPYDHSRVILQRKGIDYINASLVKAEDAGRSYILTQGPLEDTSGHFWLMAWENNSKAILMLNNIYEKRVQKCHPYFPVDDDDRSVMVFQDVGLQVRFLSEEDLSYYTIRTIEIRDLETNEHKEVLQFHYTTWPDFGVPDSPSAFLDFLMAVRQSGALSTDVGPPVIHCSAGIGRSGTFCLVDTCLVLIEQEQDPDCVDVLEVLLALRHYRMGLIQTHDQLRFSYLAIIEGTKRVLHKSQESSEDTGISSMSSHGSNEALSRQQKSSPQGSSSEGLSRQQMLFNGPNSIDEEESNAFGNDDEDEDEYVERGSSYSDDDIPDHPPPPPPRVYPGYRSPESEDINGNPSNDLGSGEEVKVLPAVEEIRNNSTPSSEGAELRRRKREERLTQTAEKVASMKAKQRASEKWKGRRSKIQPYVIGLSIAAIIGSYFFYRYYLS